MYAPTLANDRPAKEEGALDGLARLRALGRPVRVGGGPTSVIWGSVIAVDDRSITIRGRCGGGVLNAKEVSKTGTGRYGLWVRQDPTKPLVLSFPDWEVDCISIDYSRAGMLVTLMTGEQVMVWNAHLPIRRFPAAKELIEGALHPSLPFRTRFCHLLPDVKVGDYVELSLTGPLGKQECIAVTISRRVGGRIPHSSHHLEFFRDTIDQSNAYQDYEDNAIPIPDRFRRDLTQWDSNGVR